MIVELDGYSKYINQQNGCEFIFDTEDTDVVSKETWNYRKSRNSIIGELQKQTQADMLEYIGINQQISGLCRRG